MRSNDDGTEQLNDNDNASYSMDILLSTARNMVAVEAELQNVLLLWQSAPMPQEASRNEYYRGLNNYQYYFGGSLL